MKNFLFGVLSLFGVFVFGSQVEGAIVTKLIEYQEGKTTLEGMLVFDNALDDKKLPGILVVPDWMGLTPQSDSLNQAKKIAGLGYVAFIADIYGKGVRPKDSKEAGEFSGRYKSDRDLLRARAAAALKILKAQSMVDASQTVAIGYCFGGTTVLELARSGTDVKGVISFHRGLSTPTPQDAKKIKGRVLVLHGAIDPYVPEEEVQGFLKEMNEAKVDYEFVAYGGAVHSFTNPKAGSDIKTGAAYNKKADARS